MLVYVCACLCTFVHVCVCLCMFVYVCACLCTFVHVCVRLCMFVYVSAYLSMFGVCVRLCMFINNAYYFLSGRRNLGYVYMCCTVNVFCGTVFRWQHAVVVCACVHVYASVWRE